MRRLCLVVFITFVFSIVPQLAVHANPNVQVTLTDTGITPSSIQGVKGQTLRIQVMNAGRKAHNFVIPDMFIFSSNLTPGESTSISFAPDKTGRFKYFSDTGGKPEPGLSGILTVTS